MNKPFCETLILEDGSFAFSFNSEFLRVNLPRFDRVIDSAKYKFIQFHRFL